MKQLWLGVVMAILCACAAEIPRQPASLVPAARDRSIRVDEDAVVRLPSGYSRPVRAGSDWKLAGTVDGRDVYRPARGVFTIEGSHVHEAYLLLDGTTLEGFFLPGENAVSWLKSKVVLKFH